AEDGIRVFHVTGVRRVLFRSTREPAKGSRPGDATYRFYYPAPSGGFRAVGEGRVGPCPGEEIRTHPPWGSLRCGRRRGQLGGAEIGRASGRERGGVAGGTGGW